MHRLLENYIFAKYKHHEGVCICPNCPKQVKKKSANHVFCNVKCKDAFWLKVRGRHYPSRQWQDRKPKYPGGYDQWKIDLRKAEDEIVSNILLELDDDIA